MYWGNPSNIMSPYDALLLEICLGASSEYNLTEFKCLSKYW